MSNYTVGRVSVGLKRVEIRAITAEVFMRKLKEGLCPHVVLHDPLVGAQEWAIGNKVREVGFEAGDRATLLWLARGKNESDWAAGYNHRTGAFGVSEFGINQLILLPAHNFLGIVAIFAGIFSFAAGPGAVLVILPLSLGFFVYVRKRHKKVRRAIEAALGEIKQRESTSRSPQPVAGDADLDFRLKTS